MVAGGLEARVFCRTGICSIAVRTRFMQALLTNAMKEILHYDRRPMGTTEVSR
jgi:hypothetical protein